MVQIKYKHKNNHRWTMAELSKLMRLWSQEVSLPDIAVEMKSTQKAILHMTQKLRRQGVPLARRTQGHKLGYSYKLWTQGEIEYLMRRRAENATNESIAIELNRTTEAVNAMTIKLRNEEHVPITKKGRGMRRLWDADSLKAIALIEKKA